MVLILSGNHAHTRSKPGIVPPKTQTNFRWTILGFLFAATAIVYIDRSALGILAPELQKTVGWSEEQYGMINSAFMVAYAFCFIIMGQVIDCLGTKKGYILSAGIWTIAAISHVFATTWIGFAGSRFGLAIGQSGNFPAALKSVAEWFPKKERALAISIFNGGSNVGTILAPLVIPSVVLVFGTWKIAFLATLPIGLGWLWLWMKYYFPPAEHPKVSASELAYINSNEIEQSKNLSWKQIIPRKETWAIAVGKFVGDPIWWFYLFWGAKFSRASAQMDIRFLSLSPARAMSLRWRSFMFLSPE